MYALVALHNAAAEVEGGVVHQADAVRRVPKRRHLHPVKGKRGRGMHYSLLDGVIN